PLLTLSLDPEAEPEMETQAADKEKASEPFDIFAAALERPAPEPPPTITFEPAAIAFEAPVSTFAPPAPDASADEPTFAPSAPDASADKSTFAPSAPDASADVPTFAPSAP